MHPISPITIDPSYIYMDMHGLSQLYTGTQSPQVACKTLMQKHRSKMHALRKLISKRNYRSSSSSLLDSVSMQCLALPSYTAGYMLLSCSSAQFFTWAKGSPARTFRRTSSPIPCNCSFVRESRFSYHSCLLHSLLFSFRQFLSCERPSCCSLSDTPSEKRHLQGEPPNPHNWDPQLQLEHRLEPEGLQQGLGHLRLLQHHPRLHVQLELDHLLHHPAQQEGRLAS